MNPLQLINLKKSGQTHSPKEIAWIVQNYTMGNLSDVQMTAWLMAINFQGLDLNETVAYTRSLVESGNQLTFSSKDKVVDKHSTGGVGDKVSFILGPILAALGYRIPMVAGRGLEHTGGTIDKLESIPGFKTNLQLNTFRKIVENNGLAIMSQTSEICPADGKIYALRDATATVNSLALICGSILSKKIAEGISTLVLDIKIGNGAFMSTHDEAGSLGKLMQKVGQEFGLKVIPCYTNMDQPLGKTAGLWCEIKEAWGALNGNGKADLMAVVHLLCGKIYGQKNQSDIDRVIKNGKATEKFLEMVHCQGGKESVFVNCSINSPKYKTEISADQNGYIYSFDTRSIGFALAKLGAGRIYPSDNLDFSCGCEFIKKTGEPVNSGETIASVFGANTEKVKAAAAKIKAAITIANAKPEPINIILDLC